MKHWSVTQEDAVTWLSTLPAGSVDLVVTDPPYESLEKHRAKGTTTRLKHSAASSNDWFAIFPNARFADLFAQVYRVLAPNRHFYLFTDAETMFVVKPLAEAAGFKFWKPLVWDKRQIGMGYHYRARYELILFFEKGKRRLNDLGLPDIIECSRIRSGYPTEKPVAVSEVLIQQSSQPGELVVDPFLGSGSVGVAALHLGRHFEGADTAPAAIDLATRRLAEAASAAVPEAPPADLPGDNSASVPRTLDPVLTPFQQEVLGYAERYGHKAADRHEARVLQLLVHQGLVEPCSGPGRRVYRLTDSGKRLCAQRSAAAPAAQPLLLPFDHNQGADHADQTPDD